MDTSNAPALAGIHHLKLPVSDLDRARDWYLSRLGYQVIMEFVEQGRLMGDPRESAERHERAVARQP